MHEVRHGRSAPDGPGPARGDGPDGPPDVPDAGRGRDTAGEPVRLSRNRDYNVLWSSMLLSELAGEIVFIAFPLLVLAHSGTAVEVGLVTSVLAAARMAANVPAGAIADRWDRKRVMLLAQSVRSVAMLSIVAALLLDAYSLPHVLLVAAVEGIFSSVFQPAEQATLPQVVPASQLSDALARNAARPFAALLVGPALAGFAFGVHQVAPFSIDAAMLVFSVLALSLLRPRPRRSPSGDPGPEPAGHGLLDGLRWLSRQPVLRTTALWIVLVNLTFHALIVVILVMSGEDAVNYGEIGLMMTCFGVGGVIGAVVAGWLHAKLPAPVIIIGSSWMFVVAAVLMAVAPEGLLLGVLLGVAAIFFPVASTTIVTYQISIVPDGIRGRLTGVMGLCSDLAGTVGPIVGGVLVAVGGGGTAILSCAVILGLVALGASVSPTLRRFPTLSPVAVERRT